MSNIENFDNMTPEEKIEALSKALETSEASKTTLETELNNVKSTASNKASEVAKYKKMYEEKLTEAEKNEIARKEAEDARIAKEAEKDALIAEQKKQLDVIGYKAKYMESGYSADEASTLAEALANGDMAKVFEVTKAFNNAQAQALAEAKLNTQTDPSAGNPLKQNTPEEEYRKKLEAIAGV